MKLKLDYLEIESEVQIAENMISQGETLHDVLRWLYIQGMIDKTIETIGETPEEGFYTTDCISQGEDNIEVILITEKYQMGEDF